MLQDWYHTPVFEVWFTERQTPPVPGDNGLINGKNKFNASGKITGSYSEFKFQKGKKYRMRIINSSTDQHFKFSIDQHEMTVQAADFIAVKPYTQEVLNIAIGTHPYKIRCKKKLMMVGQRYDVIFEAKEEVGNYWMRAVPATDCSAQLNPNGIRAIVRYVGSNPISEPTSTPFPITSTECVDETGLVPVVPRDVGKFAYGNEEDVGIVVDKYIKFTINNSSLFIDWENPTLLMVEDHDPKYPRDYNVVQLNGTSETVFISLYELISSGLTSLFNLLVLSS